MIKTYNNTKVRTGQKITNTRMHTKGLIEYVYDKLKNEVDKVKRPQNKKIKQKISKMDALSILDAVPL